MPNNIPYQLCPTFALPYSASPENCPMEMTFALVIYRPVLRKVLHCYERFYGAPKPWTFFRNAKRELNDIRLKNFVNWEII